MKTSSRGHSQRRREMGAAHIRWSADIVLDGFEIAGSDRPVASDSLYSISPSTGRVLEVARRLDANTLRDGALAVMPEIRLTQYAQEAGGGRYREQLRHSQGFPGWTACCRSPYRHGADLTTP